MLFSELKKDIKEFIASSKEMNPRILWIFLSVAVLQTISWYITSRSFFIQNFRSSFLHLDTDTIVLYEFLYWFGGDFLSLCIIPLLLIIFVFRESPKNWGVTFGDYKAGLRYVVISVIVMMPIIWVVSAQKDFAAFYPHYGPAKDSYRLFLYYEAGLLLYMVAWEYIWRGFTLFGLFPQFGKAAVLIQMIPFLILHNGKPMLETFGAIPGGILLGAIALRTGSFVYGVIIHFAVIFSIDLLSVLRYKFGDYGISPASFVNLIVEFLKGL